jgi:hypothetical protein
VEGSQVALGVSSGEVDLADLSISRVTEKAIVVYEAGKVTLRRCTITDCSQTAIKLLAGKLVVEGGKIQDFVQHGIMVGDKDTGGKGPEITLEKVEIFGGESKFAGIIGWSGRVELSDVMLDGARYGVYTDGPVAVGKENAVPSIDVQAVRTRFENQSEYGLVARGHSRITIDGPTQKSLNASSGLKVIQPAKIVVDEREN